MQIVKTNTEMVKDFQIAFRHPVSEKPVILSDRETVNRASWVAEELIELLHATAGDLLKFNEFYDYLMVAMYKTFLIHLKKEFPEDVLVAQCDAIGDAEYFLHGMSVVMGVNPDPIFHIIHQSNMSKLFPDGLPHYHPETHKVIKPDNWIAPEANIAEEIKRQLQ